MTLRTYGRVYDRFGNPTWVQVNTDANGEDGYVWATTLCQVLKLAPNESPFFANYGIPAQISVLTQVQPDYYVTLTQTQFAQYFASLTVQKLQGAAGSSINPTYNITALLKSGTAIQQVVPT